MGESKMPARIGHRRWIENEIESSIYIRADLVEPLVEALRWALAEIDKQTTYQHPGQFLACDTKARAALSSWEGAQ